MCIYSHTHMHAHAYACTHKIVHTCICTHANTCICTYAHKHMHMHAHIHAPLFPGYNVLPAPSNSGCEKGSGRRALGGGRGQPTLKAWLTWACCKGRAELYKLHHLLGAVGLLQAAGAQLHSGSGHSKVSAAGTSPAFSHVPASPSGASPCPPRPPTLPTSPPAPHAPHSAKPCQNQPPGPSCWGVCGDAAKMG